MKTSSKKSDFKISKETANFNEIVFFGLCFDNLSTKWNSLQLRAKLIISFVMDLMAIFQFYIEDTGISLKQTIEAVHFDIIFSKLKLKAIKFVRNETIYIFFLN